MEIENVSVESLRPYAGNAKRHPATQIEQIKESIKLFGFRDPIGVWHGEVVEGHGRLIAAKEMGMEMVPIIRLDDMTDEERRAYTLVHNKLTMNSGYDPDILALELDALPEIDMEQFGFDLEKLAEEIETSYYGDERERTNNAYNLNIAAGTTRTEDFWQMPIIHKETFVPETLIGFNYAKTYKDKNVGIHFYIDDYQFERIWNDPSKYIGVLAGYDCILSPDFSLYMDMPMPMKIWNVYRSRQMGAFFQTCGIRVIPTLSWAEPSTYEFCFLGIEKGSVISVSTVGVKSDKDAGEVWRSGMDEAIKRLEPSMILEYGGDVGYDYGEIPVKRYSNQVTENWHNR